MKAKGRNSSTWNTMHCDPGLSQILCIPIGCHLGSSTRGHVIRTLIIICLAALPHLSKGLDYRMYLRRNNHTTKILVDSNHHSRNSVLYTTEHLRSTAKQYAKRYLHTFDLNIALDARASIVKPPLIKALPDLETEPKTITRFADETNTNALRKYRHTTSSIMISVKLLP